MVWGGQRGNCGRQDMCFLSRKNRAFVSTRMMSPSVAPSEQPDPQGEPYEISYYIVRHLFGEPKYLIHSADEHGVPGPENEYTSW